MNIKMKFLTAVLALGMVFSTCAPLNAEVETSEEIKASFTMIGNPSHLYEMKAEEIKSFFDKENGSIILDPTKATSQYGTLTVGENSQLQKISVLTFLISDAADYVKEDPQTDLQNLMNEIFPAFVQNLMKEQKTAH